MIAFCMTQTFADPPAKCLITVKYRLKTGGSEEKTFPTNAKSKKECASRAKLHKTNFAPHMADAKTVEYKWKEQ